MVGSRGSTKPTSILMALDYLYFVIYFGNRAKGDGEARFNPAAMIVLVTAPAINSLFGAFAGSVGQRAPIVSSSDILYARYDLWTYTSIALAALLSWQCFDKRRARIVQDFEGFKPTRSVYWLSALAAVLFILACTYLSTRSGAASTAFALAGFIAGGMLASRVVANGLRRG